MSDALLTIIVVGAIALIQTVVNGWKERKAAAQKALIDAAAVAQNAEIIAAAKILEQKLVAMDKKVDDTNTKVDEYHKETNSKLSQLVTVEKKVSFSEGEKQGHANQIILDQSKPPIVTYTKEKESSADKDKVIKHMDQAKDEIDEAKDKL